MIQIKDKTTISLSAEDVKKLILDHVGVEISTEVKIQEAAKTLADNMLEVYDGEKSLTREELVSRMREQFACGVNKITNAGGLISQAFDANIIGKDGRSKFMILIENTEDPLPEPKAVSCKEKDIRMKTFMKEGTQYTMTGIEITLPSGAVPRKKQ